MRLLFVDHQAEIVGGGQGSLLGLMAGLDRERFRPILCCPGGGGLQRAADDLGIEVVPTLFPSLRGFALLRALPVVIRLRRLLVEQGIDLLHANGSRCMFHAGLAGRSMRRPVVWHVRIAASDGGWDRVLGRLSTRIVAVSGAVQRRFAGKGCAEKVRVIYNGEELERFARADGAKVRAELGQGVEFMVGMVARLTQEKDYETFLRAAALVSEKVPGVRFLIIGDDPEEGGGRRRELGELAASLGIGEAVHFTGRRDDVPEVMAGLDLLVHCAHQEGFGKVLVEGMAAGRAVVATRVGGIPEVVADGVTGLLVEPGDSEEVARAVLELLGEAGRRAEMGRAGRARVAERFSLKTHVAQVQALYEEVLSDR